MSAVLERLLADPWGPRDPEAAALDLRLRTGALAGRLVLVARSDGQFALARLPATRPGPVALVGPVYPDVLSGERDILRRRYAALS